MHKLLLKSIKITVINDIKYHYRMRKVNLTSSFDIKIDEIFFAYEQRRKNLKNTEFYSLQCNMEMYYIRHTIEKFIFFDKYNFEFYQKMVLLLNSILKESEISKFEYVKNNIFLIFIKSFEKLKKI